MFLVFEDHRVELIEENAKKCNRDTEADSKINPVHNPMTPLNPLHAQAMVPMIVDIV